MALGRKSTLITRREKLDGEDLNRHKTKSRPGCDHERLAAREAEIDYHLGIHGHRLTIEQVWLVAPLFHGLNRGRRQHGMPTD